MTTALSARLREATREAHAAAEGAPFMRRLLAGRLDRAAYAELLANLAPLYAMLEREWARGPARERLAALRLEGLARGTGLAADLAALGRPAPGVSAPSVPEGAGASDAFEAFDTADDSDLRAATRAYVARLASLNAAAPIRLAAHAYVRYLGDLAGGQILRRIVATKLGAPVGFYDFGSAERARALAQRFRAGLDGLALAAGEADAVVDEALWAFRQHERLFGELDRTTSKPVV